MRKVCEVCAIRNCAESEQTGSLGAIRKSPRGKEAMRVAGRTDATLARLLPHPWDGYCARYHCHLGGSQGKQDKSENRSQHPRLAIPFSRMSGGSHRFLLRKSPRRPLFRRGLRTSRRAGGLVPRTYSNAMSRTKQTRGTTKKAPAWARAKWD